jgi:hypothetical protein
MGQKPVLPRRTFAVRLHPNKQTPTGRVECGAMCQEPTYAVQQIWSLLDYLVGVLQDRRGHREADCLSGPEDCWREPKIDVGGQIKEIVPVKLELMLQAI